MGLPSAAGTRPDAVDSCGEALRELLKTLAKLRPVLVEIRGGTYYLRQTLEFGPQDSGQEGAPIIYAAAEGAAMNFQLSEDSPVWLKIPGFQCVLYADAYRPEEALRRE